jgi:hypothetical protein
MLLSATVSAGVSTGDKAEVVRLQARPNHECFAPGVIRLICDA